MIDEIIPSAGMKMMYTSGWPKNQKRCCQRMGSPPSAWLKKCVLTRRSRIRDVLAITIDGMAKITMIDVISMDHTNKGIRLSDMPGVRSLNTVQTMHVATTSPETSVKVINCA